MEDLVLSIDQCRHLQELGLDMSNAKFCWRREGCSSYYYIDNNRKYLSLTKEQYTEYILPTYTLQEILDKLPSFIVVSHKRYDLEINKNGRWIGYLPLDSRAEVLRVSSFFNGILHGAYEMLCWVLENGYLK